MERPLVLGRLRPSGRVEVSPRLAVLSRLEPKQQLAESVSSLQAPGERELLSHRSTLSGKEDGMADELVHDHERYGKEAHPRHRGNDDGRGTGDVTPPPDTLGTDTNYKNPPDRGGDDSTSES